MINAGNIVMKQSIYIIIGLVMGGLSWLSFSFGFFSGVENFFEDRLFSQKAIHDAVLIIEIDDESIQKIGQWPWPRSVFADFFSVLNESAPSGVALDVLFSEQSRLGAEDDARLEHILGEVSFPVVMPAEAVRFIDGHQASSILKPLPSILAAPQVSLGHVNMIIDRDGVVRRFPAQIHESIGDATISFQSFAGEAASRTLPESFERDLAPIERIVFAAPAGQIRRIPFWRVIEGDIDASVLFGKLLFVGSTAGDLHDEQIVPVGGGAAMPGVEIQAHIANMLLQEYRLRALSPFLMIVWLLAAALVPALLFVRSRKAVLLIALNIVIGFLYTAAIILLFERGIAVNFIHISMAWVLSTAALFGYRYSIGERERKYMRRAFSKYVSKDVLAEILYDPSRVSLGGEEREVTVFFSDIRGFTTLSEKTTPTELVRILNEYFTEMGEEVLAYNGVLDKYIGDAIMAFWGAPIADPDQADHALQASLGMSKRLDAFNARLEKRGDPQIDIGIGLYTGPAIVGNVGSEERFDYTVIGDTVNAASRLEGLNKEYKTRIIISETTKQKLKKSYNIKPLGSAQVKGRTEPIAIYTVEA